MAPECVQVKIEIGHKSVCRTDTTHEGFTHDWVVFVRGAEGCNISHFVEKVVFHLHESFPKPKRVIKLPPYKVEESGYGSFMLSIEIYFRNKEEPKKVKFDYDLYLQLVGNPPVTNVRVEALTFSDPVEDFKKKLLKGGGALVSPVSGPSTSPPALANPPIASKPEASMNPQPTFSPPTASPPPQPITKNPKKTSPPTPAQQQGVSLISKPPKLKDKETPIQNSNSGVKRSSAEDTPPSQKLKKKKLDRSGDGIAKTLPKEVSIISHPDAEKEKLKSKAATWSARKNEDVKDKRKSGGDGLSSTPSEKLKATIKTPKEGKKDISKDPKPKENKEKIKREKVKKPDEKIPEEPKVQKLTVKRTSTDAWASTAKSGGNGGLNKDNALDALFNEFGADKSESGDEELETASTGMINKELNADSHTEDTKPPAPKAKKLSTKSKGITNISNMDSPKINGVKKKDITSPQNGKTSVDPNPLVELWRRISTTEDRETLQKIVDIVESTGKFEVTDSTFDFDLCCLDNETIEKLRESLSIR